MVRPRTPFSFNIGSIVAKLYAFFEKKRSATQSDMDRLTNSTIRRVNRLVTRLQSEKITLPEFQADFHDLLVEKHARAAFLGRTRAGDKAPFEADDLQFGALIAEDEAKFLDRFVLEMLLKKPTVSHDDGSLDFARIRARAQMYAGRLTGTANQTFVLASDEKELFDWILGATEHCEVCPAIASAGPYTTYTLPTYPRANQTPCLFNCDCTLKRRSDGKLGFGGVSIRNSK